MALWVGLTHGCQPASPPAASKTADGQATSGAAPSDMLLESAIELIQGTAPNEDAYRLVADRLNEFVGRFQGSGNEMKLEASAKEDLESRLTPEQMQRITRSRFELSDAMYIASSFLMHALADRLTADLHDEVAKAQALFEWTVRNIQLRPIESAGGVAMQPLFVVLGGQGRELERAWTFMVLLHQVGIESALVGVRDRTQTDEVFAPWAVAALISGQLYLFDAAWGVAIPGPGGKGVATLTQAVDDASVLDQLDIDPARRYRAHASDLSQVTIYLESTLARWAPRMKAVESRLAGRNRCHLTADLQGSADRFRTAVGQRLRELDLWELPLEVEGLPRREPKYAALVADIVGPAIAVPLFEEARRAHLRGDWNRASELYMQLRDQPLEAGQDQPKDELQKLYARVREDSTYFMAHAQFDQANYTVARDWFGKRYLERHPKGRWQHAAEYGLAVCAELACEGNTAIQHFQAANGSPQGLGNLLRAKRLGWKPGP
jgi:hypothetical protein